LGVLGDPMLLDDAYARRYELSPDVVDFLHQAVSRGMDVVTIGDEVPEWVGLFRQRYGLDEVISAWVCSGEVGVRPPHPALVQAALRVTGCPPGSAMVIARSLRLLDAARRLGCRTVQYLPDETAALGEHPLLRTFARVAS
jgi:FMN phosphatase YigB (HAD superfamily)